MKYYSFTIFLFLFAVNLPAFGDQIYLTNGDRLTGKIEKMENGKLTLKGELFDKLIIDLQNIETFQTDEPIEIHLEDETSFTEKIENSEKGKVLVHSADETEIRSYDIGKIRRIGPLPDPVKWTRQFSLAIAGSEGNSENFNFNFGTYVKRRSPWDRTTFEAEYYFERDGSDTTQDEWYGDLKYDYFFSEKFFAFSSLRLEQDDLSDLDYRFIFSPGVGYQWVERDDLNFSTEVGIAYLRESFSGGSSNNDITARIAYLFDKTLFSSVKFFHDLKLFPAFTDPTDLYLTTSAGLRTEINEHFFTEAKVRVDYDSTPAEDAEDTDLNYSLGVGVNF